MPADLAELERRIVVLERAQTENAATMKWIVGTLGQIQATVDDHTERLKRIEVDIAGLRRDIPGIIADALRHAR